MYSIWELTKRRVVAWLVALILAGFAAIGIVGPDITQAVGAFIEAFIAMLFVFFAEGLKLIFDERSRRKGKVLPDLFESNRVSSTRDQLDF